MTMLSENLFQVTMQLCDCLLRLVYCELCFQMLAPQQINFLQSSNVYFIKPVCYKKIEEQIFHQERKLFIVIEYLVD